MINDSVLIVVDMLYDFIDGSLACANSGNAVANTLDFIKKTRDEDLPVLFIRDPPSGKPLLIQGKRWNLAGALRGRNPRRRNPRRPEAIR